MEATVRETVRFYLRAIEVINDVHIIYACESGSRAWGFPSEDSDYDIRFIYVREPQKYMNILPEKQRDVIDDATAVGSRGLMEFVGWDLKKALLLLYKGNPNLIDWIRSPIEYLRHDSFRHVESLVAFQYWPEQSYHHYRSLAYKHYWRYIKGKDSVDMKRYLYTIRGVICANIAAHRGFPPVNFEEALAASDLPDNVLKHIDNLLVLKRSSAQETARIPASHALNDFIEAELERLAQMQHAIHAAAKAAGKPDYVAYNTAFIRIVHEVSKHFA